MRIEELHSILYDILCAVDDACQKENIPYQLGGGTMLGAIRHQGFIPWDDDIDLNIWRKDYPAMRQALEKHLPSYYQIVEPTDLFPYFYDFVIRVQDTRYHWHTPTEADLKYNNLQNYICVDIFTLINSADSLFMQKVLGFSFRALYGLAMGHRQVSHEEKYSFIQKLQIRFLSTIGKCIPMKTIYHIYERFCDILDRKERVYAIVTNDLPQGYGRPHKTEWHKSSVYKLFIDRMLPVPVGFHEKLTLKYGDYMKPPEDRSKYIQHMEFDSDV